MIKICPALLRSQWQAGELSKSTMPAGQDLAESPSATYVQRHFGSTQSPHVHLGMLLPKGAASSSFLAGFTGVTFSVALLWLFTLLTMGKDGNYSFIHPGRLNNWNNFMYFPSALYGCCKICTNHCSRLFRLQHFSDSAALEDRKNLR